MLALDSPLWSDLDHAYGKAADIPDLLRQLEASPSADINEWVGVWNDLYEALCHGGIDIYTASYAALPHFLRIGSSATHDAVWGYLTYITRVEVLRLRGEGPPMPEYLQESYRSAIASIPDWVYRLSAVDWDYLLCMSSTAALTVSKGQADLAWALSEMSEDNLKATIALLNGETE